MRGRCYFFIWYQDEQRNLRKPNEALHVEHQIRTHLNSILKCSREAKLVVIVARFADYDDPKQHIPALEYSSRVSTNSVFVVDWILQSWIAGTGAGKLAVCTSWHLLLRTALCSGLQQPNTTCQWQRTHVTEWESIGKCDALHANVLLFILIGCVTVVTSLCSLSGR